MTRKIILFICIVGIFYYSKLIYNMRDKINFSSTPTTQGAMYFKFSMTSNDVAQVESCRRFFTNTNDKVGLIADAKDEKKATLTIERRFPKNELQEVLDLNKLLREKGCLKNDATDTFTLDASK